ncbi:P-loop containing nucleoside triphosphate hydrolase protein [Trametes punicea]|nr:P-loop containing nucleoside triphosphate hydrolase protein [Trametes punicea]
MAPKIRVIHQNLLDDEYGPISVQEEVLESKLTKELFDDFFAGSPIPRRVGLAPIYLENGSLSRLAVAVNTQVILVQFHAKGKGANAYKGREILSSEVLCNPDVLLFAFDCDKLAIALFNDQNVRMVNGIDIQSACGSGREPLAAIKFAAGDVVAIMDENIQRTFESLTFDTKCLTSFALQAWVAQCLTTFTGMEDSFQAVKRINTLNMSEAELRVFAQMSRGEQRLALSAPNIVAHEYAMVGTKRRETRVRAERFNTRFRASETAMQRIMVRDHNTGLEFPTQGTIQNIRGRQTVIGTNIPLEGREIISIITEGHDGLTIADQERERAMRHALQGRLNIFDNPFLRYIFQPSDDFTWPDTFPISDTIPPIVTTYMLNDSQQQAVKHMLSNTNDSRITIIQGPPGTGKTTVIAAFVTSAVAAGAKGIWLMAQSNIAVKNIAEKLADAGFENWRLLVSKDFHLGWHEHLYNKLVKNVITSGEFKHAHARLQDVSVILCTLSMLANHRLHIFTKVNPITTMVVDEASQITLGNYIAPLHNYSDTIHKLCMIGDDKQLPPHASENDENMMSIFEIEHLHSSRLFLNTQYRMPPLIGDIVSEVIYDSQLRSNPHHPVQHDTPSCWFVHVEDSQEKRYETSWHNPAERAIVLKIADKLQTEGKNYAIITPYDPQRKALEDEMKEAGLIWQDKCFNVDSFQGNERDVIIVSLRGMYIVTSWNFIFEKAANTLVGRMAAAWGDEVWVNPEHLIVEA